MTRDMRISGHMYNYSDRNEGHDHIRFKAETKTARRTNSKFRGRYAPGITREKIQKVWKTQLPLRQRTRPRELLSFCKPAWQKSYDDLRLHQKSRHGQKSFSQLSNGPENYRRNQQYQSRDVDSKGNTVKDRSWYLRWKYPP